MMEKGKSTKQLTHRGADRGRLMRPDSLRLCEEDKLDFARTMMVSPNASSTLNKHGSKWQLSDKSGAVNTTEIRRVKTLLEQKIQSHRYNNAAKRELLRSKRSQDVHTKRK